MSQIAVSHPETIKVLGAPMTIFPGSEASSPFLADHPVPPGYGEPLHIHETEDEAFFILEGELTLHDGKGETAAKSGGVGQPAPRHRAWIPQRHDEYHAATCLIRTSSRGIAPAL